MGFDVEQLYAEICRDGVFFAYKGGIASDEVNSILEDIELRCSAVTSSNKLRKKIYSIMVESLQNLYHHSDDVPEDLIRTLGQRYCMIVITRNDDEFRISVGNFVTSDKVGYLTEKIEKLNTLSEIELKEMYKFILNYQKLSSKGGGGLGLIDIARKSDKRLGYKFYRYDENYYFYRLDIFISSL